MPKGCRSRATPYKNSPVPQVEKSTHPSSSDHRITTESQIPAPWQDHETFGPHTDSGGHALPPQALPLPPLQGAVTTLCLERKYLLFPLLFPTTPPMCPLATGSSSTGHGRRANRGTLSPALSFLLSHLQSLLPAGGQLSSEKHHPQSWRDFTSSRPPLCLNCHRFYVKLR